MDKEGQDTARALDVLLEEERKALLNGEFSKFEELIARKEALIELLVEAPDTAETMTSLASRMTRNQDLLSTALDGVRSVAHRLSELRKVRGSLDTYDKSGQRRSVDLQADRSLEKRA